MADLFKTAARFAGLIEPPRFMRIAMLRSIAAAACVLLLTLPAAAAPEAPDKGAHQAAMQKLSFLAGEWEGSGSIAMGPQHEAFTQKERIQFKHDGTLLLIEGNGTSPKTGATVHDALAVVTFDPKSGGYKFRSFAAVGRFADTEGSVTGNTFVWHLNIGPQGRVRYTITVENGVWREIGERSADGVAWAPFFEMTLRRK